MVEFDLVAPRSADEAFAALRAAAPDGAAVLAGGTDLLPDVDEGRQRPRVVVSLRHLPWRTLDWAGPSLTIGSTLPLRALEQDPDLVRRFPGLAEAIRDVGSVALRHRATLGGNVVRAAPTSDLVPVLLALDAEVEIVGPRGTRRLPVDRFVRASRRVDLGSEELVRAVWFPEARPSAYRWQRVRPANDISQVAVAAACSPTDRRWRIAVGGVAPRPVRIPSAAEALGAGAPTAAAVARAARAAADAVAFPSDRRASADYRRHLVATLVERVVDAVVRAEGFPR